MARTKDSSPANDHRIVTELASILRGTQVDLPELLLYFDDLQQCPRCFTWMDKKNFRPYERACVDCVRTIMREMPTVPR